ncbi:Inhibitor I29 domain containing protein [Asbolus verrucosus]|uniref:Inhibitor I29 domain containing protein n=1 Tax=Asbolus verrucosus TaxID=1661398 RepID=A0A482VKV2_ASBVE|nr:Inhibitor I29 domain containing protein [Asbolus verrucosus]
MEEPLELTPEALEQKWGEWKEMFKKKYADEEEESHRKKCFFENVKMIKEHNEKYKKGLTTFTMGINKFADLGKGEDPCGHGRRHHE